MSLLATLPALSEQSRPQPRPGAGNRIDAGGGRSRASYGKAVPIVHVAEPAPAVDGGSHRQAELFYLQKQIHTQTQMMIVLEDGERIEGVIEWYDRNSIKVRGRTKGLMYKSAIKYMYKLGEGG